MSSITKKLKELKLNFKDVTEDYFKEFQKLSEKFNEFDRENNYNLAMSERDAEEVYLPKPSVRMFR